MRILSNEEQRRLDMASYHLSLLGQILHDRQRVHDLSALLADDFFWQTPSVDTARGARRDKASYLALLANPDLLPEAERFTALAVKMLAATVHDRRVAGEAISTGLRADGIPYSNRYHQLWLFNDDDRIAEYHIYSDTQHVAEVHAEGHKLVARRFIDGLAEGNADTVTRVLADDLHWHLNHSTSGTQTFDSTTALTHIAATPCTGLKPRISGIIAQDDKVVVEAELQSGTSHVFVLTLAKGLITEIREYAVAHPGSAA